MIICECGHTKVDNRHTILAQEVCPECKTIGRFEGLQNLGCLKCDDICQGAGISHNPLDLTCTNCESVGCFFHLPF